MSNQLTCGVKYKAMKTVAVHSPSRAVFKVLVLAISASLLLPACSFIHASGSDVDLVEFPGRNEGTCRIQIIPPGMPSVEAGGEVQGSKVALLSGESLLVTFTHSPTGSPTLDDVKTLSALPHVTAVAFLNCEHLDASYFKQLQALTDLNELYVSLCGGVNDECALEISRLKRLKKLSLLNLSISDAGLRAICGMENLEEVEFCYLYDVQATFVPPLARLKSLRQLTLSQNCENDGWLGELSMLERLTSLTLNHSSLCKQDVLRKLQGLKGLRDLSLLECASLVQEDFEKLSTHPLLSSVTVRCTSSTGVRKLDAVRALMTCPSLRELDLAGFDALNEDAGAAIAASHVERFRLELRSGNLKGFLRGLSKSTQLKRLEIWSQYHSIDVPIEGLVSAKKLSALSLDGVALSKEALDNLCKVPELVELVIADCGGTYVESMTTIARIPKLRSLQLQFVKRSKPEGLDWLSGLGQLTSLRLTNVEVSTALLEKVSANLKALICLELRRCALGPEHCNRIAAVKTIITLDVSGNDLLSEDDGLKFSRMPSLELLDIRGCTKISPTWVSKIGEKRQALRIRR